MNRVFNRKDNSVSVQQPAKFLLLGIVMALMLGALAACSSAVEGTWYSVDLDSGEEEVIQFDSDGTGIEGTVAFEWKEEKGIITMTANGSAFQAQLTDRDTFITLNKKNEQTYYKDREKAVAAYESAKQERIATASAEKEKYLESLPNELVGTWYKSFDYDGMVSFTNEFTVVFNSDGTWTKKRVEHDLDYSNGLFNPTVVEMVEETAGRWEIVYTDPNSYEPYASAEEVYSSGGFRLNILDQNDEVVWLIGGEFQNPFPLGFKVEVIEGVPVIDTSDYVRQ